MRRYSLGRNRSASVRSNSRLGKDPHMKALLSIQAGGPDSLVPRELPSPVAGPGQVVIDVAACAMNFPDVLMVEDKYQFKPERPFAPGGELAGVVTAVGPGVDRLQVGDRVLGKVLAGGMVEEVALDTTAVMKIP